MSEGVEYKFYVKASPDGKSLGDCPFTQRANLAFKVKKVPLVYILIDLHNKPNWYSAINPDKTVPTLQFGERAIGDSYEILQYADATYPKPSLKPEGNKEAEEVTKNIFNLFSAYAKNTKDPKVAAEAEVKFTAELHKIDDFLGKSKGPLLCGPSWSIADCTLAPRLYHITAVADGFLHYDKYKSMKNLMKYMEYVFASEEFNATDYPREWILTGWAKYFE